MDRSTTFAATRSPSAACSRRPATCGWATRFPVRDGGHRSRPRCGSRRSTTVRRASGTCSSTRPSPGATRRMPADSALFVAGGADAGAVARRATRRTTRACEPLSRGEYLDTLHASNVDGSWGVWLVVGLAIVFAALALVNTAAMTTTERRDELATLRLLGGTAGHADRMVALEMLPTVVVGLGAGAAIVAIAVVRRPEGGDGLPARRARSSSSPAWPPAPWSSACSPSSSPRGSHSACRRRRPCARRSEPPGRPPAPRVGVGGRVLAGLRHALRASGPRTGGSVGS